MQQVRGLQTSPRLQYNSATFAANVCASNLLSDVQCIFQQSVARRVLVGVQADCDDGFCHLNGLVCY